ncbi:MAG: hypothetical protein PHI98_17040 [Eubacteriales bacterium]|nr:hypothetical protein [Eubacteriales bacterium]
MLKINGEILSRDKVIAQIENGVITDADQALLPLFLKRTGDVEAWLSGRAIDSHRTNSRLLKKALRIGNTEDAEVVLKVHAATITDTYWFRESGSTLRYEDVRFKKNMFDKLALTGDPDSFNQPYSHTPELTNTGSFEKCWRLENGQWAMVKKGNALELFSELFICRLGQALSFPMAEYRLDGDTVISPDFTNGAAVNYESADGIVGENEDYRVNFDAFWNLSPALAAQYLQIIYLDTLCFNMDRYTQNYGILRDVNTGEILTMAPNFDNNIALFARGIPKNLARENDKLIALYADLLQDERALRLAEELPTPTWEMVVQCAAQTSVAQDMAQNDVSRFIMNGTDRIHKIMQQLRQEPQLGMKMM